jgi:2-(3-amino-3-carboxypropyl)histidine synthase
MEALVSYQPFNLSHISLSWSNFSRTTRKQLSELTEGEHSSSPRYVLNPISEKISLVDTKEANRLITKITVKREQVLNAQRIGILVSTKPGQQRMKRAIHLKKELAAKGKEVFVFVSNEIIPESLLDFPDIEAWINTACYRLIDESSRFERPIVDLEDL